MGGKPAWSFPREKYCYSILHRKLHFASMNDTISSFKSYLPYKCGWKDSAEQRQTTQYFYLKDKHACERHRMNCHPACNTPEVPVISLQQTTRTYSTCLIETLHSWPAFALLIHFSHIVPHKYIQLLFIN